VLDIPIGVRTGFAIVGRGEYLQYYQPIHRARSAGYLSRLPNGIMDYFFYDHSSARSRYRTRCRRWPRSTPGWSA
jgi:hypothetical protein